MKILKSLIIAFAISMIPVAHAHAFEETELERFFDEQFREKMEEFHIPGAALSFVADGQVILEKGYGYAQIEGEIPVDPETSLFRIGSTSKLLTWTAIMQLVEQGKLNFGTDINEYLDFQIPAKLEGSTSVAEPAPITISHLLTHTAGFEDYSNSIFRLDEDDHVPLEQYIKDKLPARVFPPEEIIAYSNYGTALAGYIVEQVSGQPFAEYVQQHIFNPLGMDNSTFLQPLPAELSGKMTGAYRYVDGEFKKASFEFMPDAAGGMSSSARDMAKFMLAHLQGGQGEGGQILEAVTVDLMHSQLYTQHPKLDGMAHGFMEGTFNGLKTLQHSGSTMMYDTGLYLLPEENVGLFISYSGGNYLAHKEIFTAFLDAYYPYTPTEPNVRPTERMKERASSYVGEYHQNRKSWTTDEKFISLMMGPVQVRVDDEGYLVVHSYGQQHHFVEVEPAVYERIDQQQLSNDPFGEFNTIIFDTDPHGNSVLMAGGPMTYSKAPWYGTSSFTFLTLIASVLFIVGSFIYLLMATVVRRLRRSTRSTAGQSKWAITAKSIQMIYGLLMILFLFGMMSGGQLDPVYGFPKESFGDVPAWTSVIEIFPLLMVILGMVLLICTIAIWWRKSWYLRSRMHYSLFTVAALMLTWIFNYWNLL